MSTRYNAFPPLLLICVHNIRVQSVSVRKHLSFLQPIEMKPHELPHDESLDGSRLGNV